MTTQDKALHLDSTAENLDQLPGDTSEPSFLAQCFEQGDAWDAGNRWVRLALLLKDVREPAAWFQRVPFDYLGTLAAFRDDPPGKWGEIKARYKAIGGNAFDLEKEVDKVRRV